MMACELIEIKRRIELWNNVKKAKIQNSLILESLILEECGNNGV